MIAAASALAARWSDADHASVYGFVRSVITRVQVHPDRVDLTVTPERIVAHLEAGEPQERIASEDDASITLAIPARLKRVGVETRFILDGDESREADPALTRFLIQAHGIRDRVLADRAPTIEEVARQEGVSLSYAARLVRLAFLAPDIVSGILEGRQPLELTARGLMSDTRLPLCWTEQRRALGFAPR